MHLTKDTMNLIFLHTNKSQRQVLKPLGGEEDHGGDLAHFSGIVEPFCPLKEGSEYGSS